MWPFKRKVTYIIADNSSNCYYKRLWWVEVTTGSWRCILGGSPRVCTNSRFPPAQLTTQTNKLDAIHVGMLLSIFEWPLICSMLSHMLCFQKKKINGYSSVSYLYVMFSCCRGSSFSHIRATLFGSSSTWRSKQFSAQSGKGRSTALILCWYIDLQYSTRT